VRGRAFASPHRLLLRGNQAHYHIKSAAIQSFEMNDLLLCRHPHGSQIVVSSPVSVRGVDHNADEFETLAPQRKTEAGVEVHFGMELAANEP
jgi:hypothetical protein